MESKKLQQLQQANSHLAPIPQTKPTAFQQQSNDYRPNRSPVFQNQPQYQSFASNFAQINYPHQIRPQQSQQHLQQQQQQQQQQQHLSAHSSPKSNNNSLYLSEYSSSSQVGQPQHHHTIGSHYHFDQIYQTSSPSSASGERERLYQTAPRPTQHTHTSPQPLSKLELQFQQLQREKIQAQIKTATEALAHQQQTFALRQQLNPPVPNYHLKQNLLQNLSQQHQQQIQQQQLQQHQNRNAPPSSLNLTSHFQPAQGPMKLINQNIHDYGATATNQHPMNETFYQTTQQKHVHPKTPNNLQSPASNQIIIQQNNPGQVVNQACQTQISGLKSQPQNQKSPNSDSLSSPSHDGLERRKSGPVHTLKSPVTKRPTNAPVTMSGWLYKQGSDGLKVWRRRWFVLSEYILYYYKSQEEEKLLGTVLLPSYKISACFPEDKVYRKFAFKCEHTNMRTFVFAAETAESMTAWVRSLTLATMMQGSSESEGSPPSNNARSGDNSDSGIQTYQSQVCKSGIVQAPVTPISDNGGGSQPLYANAPPKPRRVNDGGYSSPSPEHIPERYEQDHQQIYGTRDINQTKTPDAASNPNLMQCQSPMIKRGYIEQPPYDPNYNDAIYGNARRIERDLYIQKLIQQQQQQQQKLHQLQQQQQQKQLQQLAMQQSPQHQQQQRLTNPFMHPNADRRTPDTYGPPRTAMEKNMSDYEDIYNLAVLSKSLPPNMPEEVTGSAGYQRPMSPLRYDNNNQQNPTMPMRYTPNHLENSPAHQQQQQQHVQMRSRPVQATIPRPHSADFLDYEARHPIKAKLKEEPTRAPRPKSSLDINRTPDNYYYSEASYAEKMRMQSASYLQRSKLAGLSGKPRGDDFQATNNSGTVPRDGYYHGRSDYGDELQQQQGSASVPRVQRITMNQLKKYPSQQEQFLRSASARLPRKEEDQSIRDGERKREESMKRLLEWKQRMLQSPLTRKISQQQQQQMCAIGSPSSTGNPFLAKPIQIGMEPDAFIEQNKHLQSQTGTDSKANLEYNSYSSDDEDGTENTPAGRSSPNVSASVSAELETSEIVSEADVFHLNSKELSDGDMVDNSQTFSFVGSDSNIYENNSTIATASETKKIKPLASSSFKEKLLPLEPESKYVPVYDHNSIIKSPIQNPLKTNDGPPPMTDSVDQNIDSRTDEDTDEMSFEYTDQDLDEALEAELSEEMDTHENEQVGSIDDSCENQSFYMPMAPKKPVLKTEPSELKLAAMDILNSIQKSTSDVNSQDENTYIEMTNGMSGKCVFGDDLKSTYEMILVQSSPSKVEQEPLYMELSQLHSNSLEKKDKQDKSESSKKTSESATNTLKKKQTDRGTLTRKHSKTKRNDLPDILKSNTSYLQSDESSDADDESTKDLSQNKIKTARSRFSLSDTFRPASYYLGASSSTPLGDCADSSDSEIVSPPPIPTTAIPLDEHNSEEMFLSENFDTVKRRDKSSKSNSRSSLLNTSDHRQPSQTSLTGSVESKSLSGKHTYGSNRSSLQSNLYLSACYNTERYDESSNTSSDYDLYRRLKVETGDDVSRRTSTSLSETESIELRRSSSKIDIHTKNKRRPISEDSLNEIHALGTFGIDETLSNASFDQYLGNLENVYLSSDKTSSNRMVWINDSLTNVSTEAKFNKQNGHDNNIYYENVEIRPRVKPTPENRTDDEAKAFYDSLEDVAAHEKVTLSPLKEKNLSIHDARCETEDLITAERSNLNIEIVDSVTTMSSMDLDQRSSCTVFDLTQTITPIHSRGNSNLSDSAPYYYSDLHSRDSSMSDLTKLTDLTRIKLPLKLNNQREVGVKKTGISHIHNPISHVKAANILTAAEKDHEIDQRNIYESDRMVDKNVNKMLEVSLSSNSKNYYSNKMINNKPSQLENSRANEEVNHSTSILASILKSSNSASSNQVLVALGHQSASSKSSMNISTDMSASGDQLWEEDSLWRDNLRRASHMHAKSMESLDHLGAASSVQSKLSTLNRKHMQRQAGKAITRDVTYVNDDLLTKTQLMKKQHKSQNSSDDNDVYVQLAGSAANRTDSILSDTPSDVYEVLRDETKYDIDRENIRQWDLMSSGLVNSTNKTLEADNRESHRAQTGKETSSSRESTLKRKKPPLGLDGTYQTGKGTGTKTSSLVGPSSSSSIIDAAASSATVDSNEYTPGPGSSHVFATSSDAHVHKKHSNTTH
ncbi:uncharacterized protein LOC131429277 isoform X2 [Malaya genurostris]|nr:uncharacterized protein LOC131429277 isoform X2 [Malaya genurostris]XP_058449342.1 uncharacterized protein LOC131429277 isoform X2 [Malaya genurostris]